MIGTRCPTCEALRQEVEYLKGLVDRMMDLNYPKVDKEQDIKIDLPVVDGDHELTGDQIQFGEG